MTALLLAAIPLAFLGFFNFSDFENNFKVETGSAMEIATDSSFANKTLKFNASQTIYVRVTADNDGKDKHDLNLRDNNYNLLTTYPMNRNGNQFLANFSAPNAAGIYSLEANIVSSGSVTNFVQTIEVGPSTGSGQAGNSQVDVKIENKVNTGSFSMSTPGVESGSHPENTPGVFPDNVLGNQVSQPPETQGFFASIWKNILEFLKGIF